VFDNLNIIILPYEEITGMLSVLEEGSTILLSPEKISVAIFNSIPATLKIIEDTSIPSRLKAIKNNIEIENICKTMVKDGVILTKFFHFVDENTGLVPMTEVSLTVRLHEYRTMQKDFGKFLKFDTLSLCYIDKKLIDKSLLDRKEIEWLNTYHSEVYNKISPFLTEDEKAWLKDKTDPI
jgi:Xaa-Pro aminopeptidase